MIAVRRSRQMAGLLKHRCGYYSDSLIDVQALACYMVAVTFLAAFAVNDQPLPLFSLLARPLTLLPYQLSLKPQKIIRYLPVLQRRTKDEELRLLTAYR